MTRLILAGAVFSLLGMIGTVQAEEKPPSKVTYSLTAYGIFNSATNDSADVEKVYRTDDGSYPG